jgi:hypothetical protein
VVGHVCVAVCMEYMSESEFKISVENKEYDTAISGEHMSTDQRVVKQKCSIGCTLVHITRARASASSSTHAASSLPPVLDIQQVTSECMYACSVAE